MDNKTSPSNSGVAFSVRGSVADIRFDAHLPPICSLLRPQGGGIAIEAFISMRIACVASRRPPHPRPRPRHGSGRHGRAAEGARQPATAGAGRKLATQAVRTSQADEKFARDHGWWHRDLAGAHPRISFRPFTARCARDAENVTGKSLFRRLAGVPRFSRAYALLRIDDTTILAKGVFLTFLDRDP